MNFFQKFVGISLLWSYFFLIGHASASGQCHARNVILFIGDGMGLAQIAFLANSMDEPLVLEQFPVVGLQKTHSASSLMTDSGAAATAFACGLKTYNNAIGMSADTLPCENLFERAETAGLRTGLVVTSSLVHATPASFVAHQRLRGFHEAIAVDIAEADVDYLAGGGQMYFTDRFYDNRNLESELKDQGYVVSSYDRKSFRAFAKQVAPKMAYFTSYSEPPRKMHGREGLDDLTRHAIKVLDHQNDSGFILMIEASQIDYAIHGNELSYLLSELKDMHEALKVAYAYVTEHDDTLLIVTGDHETGLMSIEESLPGKRVRVKFHTKNHSHVMVPVFALGSCAGLFAGTYENTHIHDMIVKALGL